MRRNRLRTWLVIVGWLALGLAGGMASHAQAPPPLRIDAPPALAALAQRVATMDPALFAPAMAATGLASSPQPIQVFLVPEGVPLALQTPAWVAGFADSPESAVAIFPARVPRYPYDSLDSVVVHEVTHVLIYRAARGRPVPRWFNEGLAMAASRSFSLADRSQLTWGLVSGGPDDLATLESSFGGRETDIEAAYALAGQLVREIEGQGGERASGEILRRVAAGERFEAAFAATLGRPLDGFAEQFFRAQKLWHRWVPILASSTLFWLLILLLAVLARRRKSRRAQELARRWDLEEEAARLAALQVALQAEEEPEEWIH